MKDAVWLARPFRSLTWVAAALAVVVPAAPALSQDTLGEARVRKMEAEIRALQRKVFPGGDGKFFQPEIKQPNNSGGTSATGQPASSAVTDLLTRMDALETRMAGLTAQIEQNSNRLAQLEASDAATASAASLAAGEGVAAPAETSVAPATGTTPQANLDAMTGGASKPATTTTPATTSAPPAERVSGVSAVIKPETEDSADDEYTYGFRLWDAKFHPEAQQQLKLFLDKHPTHWRATWGRNLLGRAYLDDGNAREAAKWFLQNYQADKTSARAPDSLLYLGVAMKRLEDTKRACIALAEFSETYAAETAGRLKGLYDTTRNGLDCSG
ncbi:MAG: hypothetical protein P8J20_00090 [Novosphingobium sp.]|nr:hypothetical protein [Novosphingobium sp.]